MKNPYNTNSAIIANIENQNPFTRLFTLKSDIRGSIKCDPGDSNFFKCWWPGQFILLSIPGFGEAPFAICSMPSPCNEFQVCVQRKGALTNKIFELKPGDTIFFRGPYGNGFPISKITKRNILLVAGGLGLVPLRPLIQLITNYPSEFGKTQLASGAREEKFLLFKNEYNAWQKNLELNITLDSAAENWNGHTGLITSLFDKISIKAKPIVIMCGPPVMFLPVIKKLLKLKVAESDIYVTLERRMHCGIGVCQHCVLVGGRYVCKDGPVFNYAEIKDSPGAI